MPPPVRSERVPVKAAGLAYNVEVSGPEGAPAILFGHSLLCDSRMWSPVVAVLATRWRTLNLDARGHGKSEPPRGYWTMWEEAESWVEVLDHFGLARVAIAGLSMGGATGLRFALEHPERVSRLAILDTSARSDPLLGRLMRRVLAAIGRRVGPRKSIIEYICSVMFGPTTFRTNPALVEEWRGIFAANSKEAMYWATRAWTERDAILPRLGEIRHPTLMIVGAEDPGTPPSEAELIARAIPGARLHVIQEAGHLPPLERPQAVADLLVSFFGEGAAG